MKGEVLREKRSLVMSPINRIINYWQLNGISTGTLEFATDEMLQNI